MAPEEIVQILEESRRAVNAAAQAIPPARAAERPEEGRWSALDCVEHVAIVEDRFFRWLEIAERAESPRIDQEKETDLAARLANRAERAEAPDPARPAGRFANLGEALEHFNAGRTRTIQFVRERSGELYALDAMHPRFGPVNGVELLVIVAGHARRHAEQIREIGAVFSGS